MKKSDASEPKKIRMFRVETNRRSDKLQRGKVKVTKLGQTHKKSSILTLILSVLLCLSLIPLTVHLLKTDSLNFLFWILSTFLLAFAVYPLSLKLFRRQQGLAWLFALPLGLTLISFTQWTLAYLKILAFSQQNILLITAIWALIAYANPKTAKPALLSFFRPAQWRALFLTIAAFTLALLAMSFVRGLMPAARGLEKFMDYGFMMSLWRSDFLPAADIWFAGQSINYYYYGQFSYTLLAKLAGVAPDISYNLSMASSFAYMLTLAYCIGYMLLTIMGRRKQIGNAKSTLLRTLAGIGSAIFTCFAGNAHDFFISPIAPAKPFLEKLARGSARFGDLNRYFFPDATRFIGYNPDTIDKTIHEFPYYSFLVGDLHAHLANTVFVLLFIAIMLLLPESPPLLRFFRSLRTKRLFLPLKSYETNVNFPSKGSLIYPRLRLISNFFKAWLFSGILPLATLLLAIFMMGNYWDFPIYWVLLAFFLIFTAKRAIGPQSHWLSFPLGLLQLTAVFLPFLLVSDVSAQAWFFISALLFGLLIYLLRPSLWTSVGLSLSLSFAIAHLFIIPFNQQFSPMAKELAIVKHSTPLYQLLILYGPQALVFLLFFLTVLFLAILRFKKPAVFNKSGKTKTVAIEQESSTLVMQVDSDVILSENELSQTTKHDGLRRPLSDMKGKTWLNQKSLLPQHYKKEVDKRRVQASNKRQRANSRSSFIRRINPGTLAILFLLISAFGLILAPEFIYVRDIYENGFARANTMFKFTYQASILLGLALPAACLALLLEWLLQKKFNLLAKTQHEVSLAATQMDKTAGVPLNPLMSNRLALAQEKAEIHAVLGLRPRKLLRFPILLVFVLVLSLLSALLVYPFAATFNWLPPLKLENYKGLDAKAWMSTERSSDIDPAVGDGLLKDDLAIINWFNSSVSGQPVILEANGLSYTDSSRISAYTGLPTVLGWQTHEWLWRTSSTTSNAYATIVAPRESDVQSIYTTKALAELQSLLRIYNVKYIVLGDIERSRFPEINEALLQSVGREVFRSGTAYVIELGD